ncbi:MAG: hypothetical protein AB7D39_09665 [Pseudodesulfovibrio sp.]|uniref:hypothetical protein n=1 Tax=Pseudodesulfovibrio sp. TaxID=2035812 RepID=UPI003D0C59FD
MGNEASPQVLQQGMNLFGKVKDELGDQITRKEAASNARDRAALIETDAAGAAHDTRRRAVQDAAGLREDRERSRSMGAARWGGSGLAMSGSKALIRDADRLKDRQAEEDVLFEGEMNAGAGLRSARNSANMLRIGEDASPARSTLSMGSKIYGRD